MNTRSLSPPFSGRALLLAVFALAFTLVASPGCTPSARNGPPVTVTQTDPDRPTSQLDTVAQVADTLEWVLPSMRALVPLLPVAHDGQMIALASVNEAIEVNRDLQAAVAVARRARDQPWDRCATHAVLTRLKDHLLTLARDLAAVGFAIPPEVERVLGVVGGVEDALLGPCDPSSPDVGPAITHELTRLRAPPRALRPFPALDPSVHDGPTR